MCHIIANLWDYISAILHILDILHTGNLCTLLVPCSKCCENLLSNKTDSVKIVLVNYYLLHVFVLAIKLLKIHCKDGEEAVQWTCTASASVKRLQQSSSHLQHTASIWSTKITEKKKQFSNIWLTSAVKVSMRGEEGSWGCAVGLHSITIVGWHLSSNVLPVGGLYVWVGARGEVRDVGTAFRDSSLEALPLCLFFILPCTKRHIRLSTSDISW